MQNPIQEAVQLLRTAADRLQTLQASVTMPVGDDCTLQEAFNRLRGAGARGYLSLGFTVDCHDGDAPSAKWSIYADKASHVGGSLGDAVNACLLALKPPPAEPVLAVQRVLDAAVPLPF